MSTDVTAPQPPPAASSEQAEALLDTANSASQHVAVLHVAFMALCAYVLVIVFGTTDMDLLIGKGVKLPVVDVTVPIVGFYAVAPYLVVLVHFNLLLQLQLLSRQLYNFDTAVAKEEERLGGLRDRLHIFPYTYYLVGRPGPIVRRLLGIGVGITLLVLPLATLLVLQLRFLAYQDQAVTWAQRIAVWVDVALVIILWPLIMDWGDSWRDYLRRVRSYLRQHWAVWAVLWVFVVMPGLATTTGVFVAMLWTMLGLFMVPDIVWWRDRRRGPEDAIPVADPTVRGMLMLLLIVNLGVPLPLILLAEGEWLLAGHIVDREVNPSFRRLDLVEEALFAKPNKPELLTQLREGDPIKIKEALRQVEPVKLRGRRLRGAKFTSAFLPRADMSEARLQGADLWGANLQGANMTYAYLQGAEMSGAQLQGADLMWATLRGTHLERAQLQGAILMGAQLQGAILTGAQLQGANLMGAKLQGADLVGAKLQGAKLLGAQLQGADLREAQIEGANLRVAELYGATIEQNGTALVDLRAALWTPLEQAQVIEIR